MRGFKIAAIAIGAIIVFLLVGTVVHVIISALIGLAVAALVVGGIYVAIKVARSNKQVSSKPRDSEIRDHHSRSSALPRADMEQYSTPAPRPAARPSAADVDDELARLKREMGS
jgi:predicted lipid-binding transport protein (Tim44 family)